MYCGTVHGRPDGLKGFFAIGMGILMNEAGMYQIAVFFRGNYMQHYSAIEFSMNELLVRASLHEEYNEYRGIPFSFNEKIKRIFQMFNKQGPLNKYSDRILPKLEYLKSKVKERNLIVHGWMNYAFISEGNAQVEFVLYSVSRDKNLDINIVTTERLLLSDRDLAKASGDLRDVMDLFVGDVIEIIENIPLPQIVFAPNDSGILTGTLRRRFSPLQ
jgi:hypothetical protein